MFKGGGYDTKPTCYTLQAELLLPSIGETFNYLPHYEVSQSGAIAASNCTTRIRQCVRCLTLRMKYTGLEVTFLYFKPLRSYFPNIKNTKASESVKTDSDRYNIIDTWFRSYYFWDYFFDGMERWCYWLHTLHTPWKDPVPIDRRLGGPQGRFGRAENLTPLGFDPRTVQPVASRCTDYATRPTNDRGKKGKIYF